MNKDDLIKKLESLDLPKIELQTHKYRLKMALLNSGYFKEEKIMNPIPFWTKRIISTSFFLILILVVSFIIIQPKLQIAKATEIAKNNPQVQQLMKDYGVEIKEVKLKNSKAYVLLGLGDKKIFEGMPMPLTELGDYPSHLGMVSFNSNTNELEFFLGSIVKIDLKGKKVENIESIKENDFRLGAMSAEVRERAMEIVKSDPNIKLPKDAEVIEVRPMPPLKLKLETTSEGRITAVPSDEKEDKKVAVVYRLKDEKSIILFTVNLDKGKVEGGGMIGKGEIPEVINRSPLYEGGAILEPLDPTEGEGNVKGNVKEIQKNHLVERYTVLLKEIAEKDQRIKDLLRNNDYKILEVIPSKPVISRTEREYMIRVESATVILEKISTGEKYWITIDLASNTVKSIEKK